MREYFEDFEICGVQNDKKGDRRWRGKGEREERRR